MFNFKFLKPLIMTPIAVAFLAVPSFGETNSRIGIPADAGMADPVSLIRMFSGRTADWGGGSAAFWSPDGTFKAVNSAEQSLGYGTWYVTTASRMCYEGTWAWRQDFGVNTREVSVCTRYAIDAQGQVWTTTEDMGGPWFPFFDDNLNTGDSVTPSFNAMVRMLGLEAVPTGG